MSKYVQGVLSTKNLQHPEKYVGKFKDNISVRSSWELSFLHYVDQSPNIKKWLSEETVVIYKGLDGRNHRYFIDFTFWVEDKLGNEKEFWIEIKPHHYTLNKPTISENSSTQQKYKYLLEWQTNHIKWAAARKEAIRKKAIFKILTEKDLKFHKHE